MHIIFVALLAFAAGCTFAGRLSAHTLDRLKAEKERVLWDLRKKGRCYKCSPTKRDDVTARNQTCPPVRPALTVKGEETLRSAEDAEPSPVDVRTTFPLFTRPLETIPHWALHRRSPGSGQDRQRACGSDQDCQGSSVSDQVERPPGTHGSSVSSSAIRNNLSLCESSDMEIPDKVAKRGPPYAPAMPRGSLTPDFSKFTRSPKKWNGVSARF